MYRKKSLNMMFLLHNTIVEIDEKLTFLSIS